SLYLCEVSVCILIWFFFSSRRRHTRSKRDWSSDVCSSDLHFTPRDIVRLTTGLVFSKDDDVLNGDGIIRTIYDPTAGTGGFLSRSEERRVGKECRYRWGPGEWKTRHSGRVRMIGGGGRKQK